MEQGWEQLVRQQLDRILAGATFRQVDRLRRFLSFVVTEAIAGRRDELKEYVVGIQVFGKEASFDPRSDPVVRVQARRLRARLVRYYAEEGQADEILIDLPKGGYAPVFSRREASAARRPSISGSTVSPNTTCVMPFADYSPAGDLGHFCGGLREEMIHRLSSLASLRVLAWTGNDSADRPNDGPSAGEAAIIISGGVRVSADHMRVTVQFLDGASGGYLWSASVDGSMAEAFDLQERVAAAVADRIESVLVELSTSGRPRPGTVNLAAYNLYLQGRYHLSQRTEESLRRAVEFFEKSLAEDAEYGLAYAGLSDGYSLLAHYGVLGPADVWTKVASTAASAVSARPGLRRSAYVAGACQGDPGLGLARGGTGVSTGDGARSAVRHRASLVLHDGSGSDREAGRVDLADARCAVPGSRLGHYRPRSRGDVLLHTGLRVGTRAM